jgi:DNA-binding NarL/FixJ family response regulator
VRTVLVCVRTTVAAQMIATFAARLGLGSAVRTALTAADALAQLAAEPADVVLADTALSRPDSAEFTRRMLATAPGAVLMLFGHEDARMAAAALAAGARGVLRSDQGDPVTLVAKTLLLLLGHAMLSPREHNPRYGPAIGTRPGSAVRPLASHAPGLPQPHNASAVGTARALAPADGPAGPQRAEDPATPRRRVELTERELQVLRGMADGKSNAEIGRELYVSEDTVKTHARRLFRKLGARDRAHAVASAFRAGLVS